MHGYQKSLEYLRLKLLDHGEAGAFTLERFSIRIAQLPGKGKRLFFVRHEPGKSGHGPVIVQPTIPFSVLTWKTR